MTDRGVDPEPDDDGDPNAGVAGETRDDRYVGDADLTRWETPAGRVAARLAAKYGPYTSLAVTLILGVVTAVGLSIVAVAIYDAVTDGDGISAVDQPALDLALSLRSPVADVVVTAFTDTASSIGMTIIAVVTVLVLSLRRRSWTPLILTAATAAGSLAMTVAGKGLIGRERPPLVDAVPPFEFSPSFPSGHTLNAVAVVGVLAYLLILRRRSRGARWAIAAGVVVYAILVGLSRVYLGHHWLTDVLVGWVLGAAWLAVVITAHRLYLTAHVRRHTSGGTGPKPDVRRR